MLWQCCDFWHWNYQSNTCWKKLHGYPESRSFTLSTQTTASWFWTWYSQATDSISLFSHTLCQRKAVVLAKTFLVSVTIRCSMHALKIIQCLFRNMVDRQGFPLIVVKIKTTTPIMYHPLLFEQEAIGGMTDSELGVLEKIASSIQMLIRR